MGNLGIFEDERKRWIQFDEDTEVLIKFVGREELRKLQMKAEKTASLTGADVRAILYQHMGRVAVLGWRRADDHEHPGLLVGGKPLPYSPDNVDMLMGKSTEFFRFVDSNCINSRLFLEEEQKMENSKNA